MKKLLCAVLALCLMLTMLAACSGSSDTDKDATGGKTSSPSASDGDTAKPLADIADYEGTWKLGNGTVGCYTVNATDKTVTAYAYNGIVLGVFPVVATTDGIVLKMGTFGNITLSDPTALTVTAVPVVSDYDIKGTYDMIYGEYDGEVLTVEEANWTIAGDAYNDTGTYEIQNGEAVLSPTKELGGNVYHKILGGGKILQAYQPSSRIYVEKEYAQTNDGKTLINYYDLIMNTWVASDDANYTVDFTDKGRVVIAGADMGIWYPTSTGATAEFTDGSSQYVEYTDEGINFYYKDFTRQ